MIRTKSIYLALLAVLLSPMAANADIIGGSLLDQPGADLLETSLGIGDQDFTNVFQGDAGVATAADFHSAVDGIGPTISIFGIILGDGSTASIGGYTALNWGASTGYHYDASAFIFNLDTGEVQQQLNEGCTTCSIYRSPDYFPTFGNGHDIFAGVAILGTLYGGAGPLWDGYSYSAVYDQSQGQISIANDSGPAQGNSAFFYDHWTVTSLEVYTFDDAATTVPEPGTLALLGLGLVGMAARRRKTSL